MTLKSLALNTQRKTPFVDSAIKNKTAGINRNLEKNVGSKGCKNSFVQSACREELKCRMYSLYVTIRRLYKNNQS
jgi:hypothetical protein